jgi:hypothetical protein
MEIALHEVLLPLLNVLAQGSVGSDVVIRHHAHEQITALLDDYFIGYRDGF